MSKAAVEIRETTPPEPSLRQLLRQLWSHLSRRRRAQLGLLLLVMVASSLAEVVSLAAVLPFLGVLANPSALWSQPLVQQLAPRLGITSPQSLLIPVTLIFAIAAIWAGAIRLLTLWLNGRLAAAIGSDLSCEAYRRTLYQPYEVQVALNSSSLIASITTDVFRVIFSVLNPLLQLISSLLVLIALVFFLVLIDWKMTLGTGIFIFILYWSTMVRCRYPLQQLSQQQVILNRRLIQTLQEGLGSIRDVLLDGSQKIFEDSYRHSDQHLRRSQAKGSFLSTFPRLVVDPASTALLALVGYLLVLQAGLATALPLLGALALGSQRLLPMVQKIYEAWAMTRNAKSSIANLIQLLSQPLPETAFFPSPRPITLHKGIRLQNISFRYRANLPDILVNINLDIRKGERIGITGSSGSGKSSLVDVLMGLLTPTRGLIAIDEANLHDPNNPSLLAAWRASIAHVPQNIYLADSSIAENIAFGTPYQQIDMRRVRKAAQEAQIADFIESSPQGYNTYVGERGIRLSGGQRQRIGIARALYKNAQVLVFDEATASLDNETEKQVIDSVQEIGRHITIVMIAHRLSTLQQCDRLVHLNKGSIVPDSHAKIILSPNV